MTAHNGNGGLASRPNFGDRLTEAVADARVPDRPRDRSRPGEAVARRGRSHERGAGTARVDALGGRGRGRRRRRESTGPSAAGVVSRLETAAAVLAHCRALIDAAGAALSSRSSRSSPASSASALRAGSRSSTSASTPARAGCWCSPTASAATSPSPPRPTRQALVSQHAVAVRPRRRPRRRRLHRQPAARPRRAASRWWRPRASHAGGHVRARPHVQPGRGRHARPRARHRRAAVGAAGEHRRRARRSRAARASTDVGAVTGATEPQHLARLRELMPHTPFLLPGIGAQGGDVARARPGVRSRPRRRPRHGVALDRQRPPASRRLARRRRPRRGRAPA